MISRLLKPLHKQTRQQRQYKKHRNRDNMKNTETKTHEHIQTSQDRTWEALPHTHNTGWMWMSMRPFKIGMGSLSPTASFLPSLSDGYHRYKRSAAKHSAKEITVTTQIKGSILRSKIEMETFYPAKEIIDRS